ncbi:MAG: polysaccharide deacetylase family protein [Sterolibacteriaceae bacterium]|uniref:Polysaccharide deacetylase family protein n=1 Tax=Candidatus Methylophosphatis roskildensis TaxID=2899263 RepID=A0A9D7HL91_9PROT|nr:polysaccharide deacetylase family protein [Candidatus Methylophosphatis roskildensis]MBK7235691.1 polysaccharide deacetylase family protein [Sterolibacteriaceae bacterium]
MNEIVRITARHVRHAALAGLRAVGGFRWIAGTTWRRRRVLVLCYHGVSLQDEHEWDPELFVTPAFLRRRFEILRDSGYEVLPLGEAVRNLRCGTLPHRSVVLTFDDGFHNFLAAAVPLLEEFGYPATNYVSSYHVVHQRPILRLTLRYLLWRARTRALAANVFPGQDAAIKLEDSQQRERLAASLLKGARTLSDDREAQHAWVGEVATRLGVDWDNIVRSRLFHLMTTAEIAEIARRGFDAQLHTHRHRTPREESIFRREILDNRRVLEELTGRPATHFCYPSGDVDPVFLPWLRGLGVETATTCAVGLAKAGDNQLLLPRYIDTMAQSETAFKGWLSGAAGMLSRRDS